MTKPTADTCHAVNRELFDFIKASPTPYHAVAHIREMLTDAGLTPLTESEKWALEPGRGYFVTRNGSSLIAFKVPKGGFSGFMMAAAHCDSPCFKIKENATLSDGAYARLSVEKYGGMLCSTWMDRPLSAAGRVVVRTEKGAAVKLADLSEPCAIIPSVAIHMNRNANDSASFNPAVDMLPLFAAENVPYAAADCGSSENIGTACNAPCSGLSDPVGAGDAAHGGESFRSRAARAAGVCESDILSADMFLYNPQPPVEWDGFIAAPRLDDLQCAYAAVRAFAGSTPAGAVPVCCIFDNEEVGSQTKQGAASTFLADTLRRICLALGISGDGYQRCIASSFLVSCDNAHAVHPNHPEYMDKNHAVYMNRGIVIKYNANQRYTSDAVSSAIFKLMCERAQVPVQYYANRADMPGGSTLGNIANTQVSLNTVDVGLPQLAMHSAYETAGALDTAYMVRALSLFFGSALHMDSDGEYTVE